MPALNEAVIVDEAPPGDGPFESAMEPEADLPANTSSFVDVDRGYAQLPDWTISEDDVRSRSFDKAFAHEGAARVKSVSLHHRLPRTVDTTVYLQAYARFAAETLLGGVEPVDADWSLEYHSNNLISELHEVLFFYQYYRGFRVDGGRIRVTFLHTKLQTPDPRRGAPLLRRVSGRLMGNLRIDTEIETSDSDAKIIVCDVLGDANCEAGELELLVDPFLSKYFWRFEASDGTIVDVARGDPTSTKIYAPHQNDGFIQANIQGLDHSDNSDTDFTTPTTLEWISYLDGPPTFCDAVLGLPRASHGIEQVLVHRSAYRIK